MCILYISYYYTQTDGADISIISFQTWFVAIKIGESFLLLWDHAIINLHFNLNNVKRAVY